MDPCLLEMMRKMLNFLPLPLLLPFDITACEHAQSPQSCPTLCDPMVYSRGSSHPGIEPESPALQADLTLLICMYF